MQCGFITPGSAVWTTVFAIYNAHHYQQGGGVTFRPMGTDGIGQSVQEEDTLLMISRARSFEIKTGTSTMLRGGYVFVRKSEATCRCVE